jgi:ATP-dependent Clp protease adaptor protein ClpS
MIWSETQTLEREKTEITSVLEHELILFNDEVNTFDWVIISLMEVCAHSLEQAEQSAWITHYKGKCGVKSGSYDDLKPMCTSLLNRGLSASLT